MLPALSQSLRLKAGLNIPEVHVGKVVGFFFLMLKMVYDTMRLMGRYNWWAPRPLKWLWERVGLKELEGLSAPARAPVGAGDDD